MLTGMISESRPACPGIRTSLRDAERQRNMAP